METARIKTSKGNVCWHDMLFNRHRRRHRGFKQMPPQPEAVKHVACYSLYAALFFLMKMAFSVFFRRVVIFKPTPQKQQIGKWLQAIRSLEHQT